MRPITFSLLVPTLATASSLLPARQVPLATITSVTAEGPACPSGSFSTNFSGGGAAVTVIYDAYKTDFQQGLIPPPERDLDCDIVFHLNFPIGCTQVTAETTYHGFVWIETGGLTGDVEPSYILSPGQLTGVDTAPTRFDSKAAKSFVRDDKPTAKVTVRNANEQAVKFESRTRLRVITTGSEVSAAVWLESMYLSLSNQKTC
jgi:hypothetical protein